MKILTNIREVFRSMFRSEGGVEDLEVELLHWNGHCVVSPSQEKAREEETLVMLCGEYGGKMT